MGTCSLGKHLKNAHLELFCIQMHFSSLVTLCRTFFGADTSSKLSYGTFTTFIPWESNPQPWCRKHCELLFELQETLY